VPATVSPSTEDAVALLRFHDASRRRARRRIWTVVAVAMAPLLVTGIYVFLIATPMYSSEARFAVRGGEGQLAAPPPLLSTGAPMPAAGFVDGYAVRDFLLSRTAMQEILQQPGLVDVMTRSDADPFVRVGKDASEEEIYDAYRANVNVQYNMVEQIVVLDVYAFEPEDAVRLATVMIDLAERFANRMNLRAREDWLRLSEQEVKRAEERAAEARVALEKWRNENANIDPSTDVTILTNVISELEGRLSAAQLNLSEIESLATESVQRRILEGRIQNLQQKISALKGRLGGSDGSLAEQVASYERLGAEQEFAASSLAGARQTLEQARLAILRQQRFVSVIAEPQMNRRPAYPDTLRSLSTALVAGLALAFLTSIVAGLVRNAVAG
jgi:capsular polysaccharide transport system permease protein